MFDLSALDLARFSSLSLSRLILYSPL